MYIPVNKEDFPFHRQQTDNECALSCLIMISDFYGKPTLSLDYLRTIIPVDHQGASIHSVVKAIKILGYKALVVSTLYVPLLEKASLPCIILWKNHHYVIIYKIDGGLVYLADPNAGLLAMTLKDFLSLWEDAEAKGWIILLAAD